MIGIIISENDDNDGRPLRVKRFCVRNATLRCIFPTIHFNLTIAEWGFFDPARL